LQSPGLSRLPPRHPLPIARDPPDPGGAAALHRPLRSPGRAASRAPPRLPRLRLDSTVFGVGPSEAAALADARRHLAWALAYLLASGRTLPPKR